MDSRAGYVVSLSLHGCLLWLLAATSDVLHVDFAVRSGESYAYESAASRAGAVVATLDTLLPDIRNEIQFALPEPAQPRDDKSPRPPVESVEIADHYVERPPLDEALQRMKQRGTTVAALPELPPEKTQQERPPEIEESPLEPPLPASEDISAPEVPVLAKTQSSPVMRNLAPTKIAEIIEPETGTVDSVASRVAQGAKVDQLPSPLPANIEPIYPEELRRRQIGGRVVLDVKISPAGTVEQIRVMTSSGEPLLDDAALTAVRRWRFQPARRGGMAVAFSVRLPISFSIRR